MGSGASKRPVQHVHHERRELNLEALQQSRAPGKLFSGKKGRVNAHSKVNAGFLQVNSKTINGLDEFDFDPGEGQVMSVVSEVNESLIDDDEDDNPPPRPSKLSTLHRNESSKRTSDKGIGEDEDDFEFEYDGNPPIRPSKISTLRRNDSSKRTSDNGIDEDENDFEFEYDGNPPIRPSKILQRDESSKRTSKFTDLKVNGLSPSKTAPSSDDTDKTNNVEDGGGTRRDDVPFDPPYDSHVHLHAKLRDIDEFVDELTYNPTLRGGRFDDIKNMEVICLTNEQESDRKIVGDYLVLKGTAKAMKGAYEIFLDCFNVTALSAISSKTKAESDNKPYYQRMKMIIQIIGLHAYTPFGESCCAEGLLKFLVDDLKTLKVEDMDKRKVDVFDTNASYLHNYLTNPVMRQPIREYDTVKTLLPFLKSDSKEVKLLTICTLAKLVDETENEHLLADDSLFDILFEYMRNAWEDKSRSASGWTLRALIKGMAGIAKNDSNKKVLVKKGAVPLLKEIMKDGSSVEKERAAGCIWELAFDKDNKQQFSEDEELIGILEKLKTHRKEALRQPAVGALWEIQKSEVEVEQVQSQGVGDENSEVSAGHVMISYQWGDQPTLLKVRDSLQENGYKVWMDVDDMSESTLEAMAKGVENAAVVLVCMSERYKFSQNCRSEAEYAFRLKKKIVPLIMQRKYNPDGWLGMILGAKLFFDFSGKYVYNDKLDGLLKELGNCGKQWPNSEGINLASMTLTRSLRQDSTRGGTVATWSKKDVKNWLTKIGLQDKSSLDSLSGDNLVFLQDMSVKAPEYYLNYVEKKLDLTSLNDMMSFCRAVEKL